MTQIISDIYPIVHLAIDVQERWYKKLLASRCEKFPSEIAQFADHLRELSIPTKWVAFDNHMEMANYAKPRTTLPPDRWQHLVQHLEFGNINIHAEDDVFVKIRMDAFYGGALENNLRETKTGKLVITGMNTIECVPRTALGAARANFPCVIITDLLAETNSAHLLEETNPDWHKVIIQHAIRKTTGDIVREEKIDSQLVLDWLPKISFMTAAEYLASLAEPNPPERDIAPAGTDHRYRRDW